MNTKKKGNNREYKTIKFLEDNGFKCTRSAASLGIFDIIGVSPDSVMMIQVKSNRKPNKKEMDTLNNFFDIRCPNCNFKIGKRYLYIWKDYQRKPEIIEL